MKNLYTYSKKWNAVLVLWFVVIVGCTNASDDAAACSGSDCALDSESASDPELDSSQADSSSRCEGAKCASCWTCTLVDESEADTVEYDYDSEKVSSQVEGIWEGTDIKVTVGRIEGTPRYREPRPMEGITTCEIPEEAKQQCSAIQFPVNITVEAQSSKYDSTANSMIVYGYKLADNSEEPPKDNYNGFPSIHYDYEGEGEEYEITILFGNNTLWMSTKNSNEDDREYSFIRVGEKK